MDDELELLLPPALRPEEAREDVLRPAPERVVPDLRVDAPPDAVLRPVLARPRPLDELERLAAPRPPVVLRVEALDFRVPELLRPALLADLRPVLLALLRPVLLADLRPVLLALFRPVLVADLRPVLVADLRPVLVADLRPVLALLRPVLVADFRPVLADFRPLAAERPVLPDDLRALARPLAAVFRPLVLVVDSELLPRLVVFLPRELAALRVDFLAVAI